MEQVWQQGLEKSLSQQERVWQVMQQVLERMLQEQKIDLDLCHSHSQRFPVRLMNVGDFTQVLTDTDNEDAGGADCDSGSAKGGAQ